VAKLGCRFTAQQDRGSLKDTLIQGLLDSTLSHEFQEASFVPYPLLSSLPVGVEYVPGRGERRFVEVLRATKRLEEEREVLALGEPR